MYVNVFIYLYINVNTLIYHKPVSVIPLSMDDANKVKREALTAVLTGRNLANAHQNIAKAVEDLNPHSRYKYINI
jgi:hypothetical protein